MFATAHGVVQLCHPAEYPEKTAYPSSLRVPVSASIISSNHSLTCTKVQVEGHVIRDECKIPFIAIRDWWQLLL